MTTNRPFRVFETTLNGRRTIIVDPGDNVLCDDCNRDCNDEQHGARFGNQVSCGRCTTARIAGGMRPDEVPPDGMPFHAWVRDVLRKPARELFDRLASSESASRMSR